MGTALELLEAGWRVSGPGLDLEVVSDLEVMSDLEFDSGVL